MKFFAISLASVFVAAIIVGNAAAVPPGETVQWNAPMGMVTFDGTTHANASLTCGDCHPALFQMKDGADTMTMADMDAGKYCGACHNGARGKGIQIPGSPHGQGAFDVADPSNCMKCHGRQSNLPSAP